MRPKKILVLGNDNWVNLGGKALSDLGHEVDYATIPHTGSFFESIRQKIESFKPDLCFARNFYFFDPENPDGPRLEEYIRTKKMPVALWYLDNPFSSGSLKTIGKIKELKNETQFVFFPTDGTCTDLLKNNGNLAFHMPHSIDRSWENMHPSFPQKIADSLKKSGKDLSLTFAGTPPLMGEPLHLVIEKNVSKQEEQKLIQMACQNWGGILDHYVRGELPGGLMSLGDAKMNALGQALYQFASQWYGDIKTYLRAKENLKKVLADFFKTTHEKFLDTLDFQYSNLQLATTLYRLTTREKDGLTLFGGEGWKNFFGPYQSSYPRLDFSTELPQVFAHSKIIFCLTKWQYHGVVHDRPMTVFAYGGFAITDYRSEMDMMFAPDELELVSYRTFDEAMQKIDKFLSDTPAVQKEREEIKTRIRKRLFGEHTYHHRMKQMMEDLQEVGIILG